MKKLVCTTGIILISCVLAGTFFAPSKTVQAVQTMQTQPSVTAKDIFIIKAENSRVVVYKKGESQPYMTTDTLTDSLPRGDILKLENGIEITGKAQLAKALEDYCS